MFLGGMIGSLQNASTGKYPQMLSKGMSGDISGAGRLAGAAAALNANTRQPSMQTAMGTGMGLGSAGLGNKSLLSFYGNQMNQVDPFWKFFFFNKFNPQSFNPMMANYFGGGGNALNPFWNRR